jgi:hypothetical protein
MTAVERLREIEDLTLTGLRGTGLAVDVEIFPSGSVMTTIAGRFSETDPRPYVIQAPTLG